MVIGVLPSEKTEFTPLLPSGFHSVTVEGLKALCVEGFPASTHRSDIFDKLHSVIQRLNEYEIPGELWVDGSFLTEKMDPGDVDLLLVLGSEFVETRATPDQKETLKWSSSSELKGSHSCDAYLHIEYPKEHPLYNDGQWMRAYWIRQYGFSRDTDMKGIAVITLGTQAYGTSC